MFPFVPGRRVRSIDRLMLVFAAPEADPGRHHSSGSGNKERTATKSKNRMHANGQWPGFFYGVIPLERPLGPLTAECPPECWVEVPNSVGDICSAYLIAHYDAQCWPRCGPPHQPSAAKSRGKRNSDER